ncbi:MAG: hypothetical protein ACFCUU_07205 [Cyclobacteriaceae bacterium]
MKITPIIICSLITTCHLFGQNEPKSKEFKRYQTNCKVSFRMPEGYKEKKVKKLPSLKYDLNLVNEADDNCIRYTFYDGEMSSCYVYDSFNRLNLMNLTQMDSTANIYEYINVDSLITNSLKVEKAGYTAFDIRSGYGKGYKYCIMVFAHKHGIANLYITILSNSNNEALRKKLIDVAVNSINFKDE